MLLRSKLSPRGKLYLKSDNYGKKTKWKNVLIINFTSLQLICSLVLCFVEFKKKNLKGNGKSNLNSLQLVLVVVSTCLDRVEQY